MASSTSSIEGAGGAGGEGNARRVSGGGAGNARGCGGCDADIGAAYSRAPGAPIDCRPPAPVGGRNWMRALPALPDACEANCWNAVPSRSMTSIALFSNEDSPASATGLSLAPVLCFRFSVKRSQVPPRMMSRVTASVGHGAGPLSP